MTVRRTSIDTYNQIISEDLLSRRRREVYSALYEWGPCTANELFHAMKSKGLCSSRNQQANLTPRLGELRELGCVREVDEVTCPITGRIVIRWETTDNLPKTIERDPIRKIDDEIRALKKRELKLLAKRRELMIKLSRVEDGKQFSMFDIKR